MRTFCFSSICLPYSLWRPRPRRLFLAERSAESANFCVCAFSKTVAPRRFAILYRGPVIIFKNLNMLDAPRLRRTRTVMRYRRHVLDRADLHALARERTQYRFAAGTDTANNDGRFLKADHHPFLAKELADLRRCIGSRLARAGEAKRTRRGGDDGIPLLVRKDSLCVVKRRFDVQDAFFEMVLRRLREGALLPPLVEAATALLDDAFLSHR